MNLVRLEVDRIQYSETQTGAYILFLKDIKSQTKIPIVIGGMEAHSITMAMEDSIKSQRPLTHDLMKNLMDTYHISLESVIIDKFEEGIFYAKLITRQADGNHKNIDSRTSDAIALAVRFNSPIYCKKEILDETGIVLPENITNFQSQDINDEEDLMEVIQQALENISEITQKDEELTEIEKLSKELFGKRTVIYTKNEINKMLQDAIDEEQYERAAKLKRYMDLM